MIELDVTKPKNFKFDINIDGISTDVLSGFMRLEINSVEYGFPAVVTNESISVDIPSLKNIVNREIKNGEKINARLDVTGDGYYMAPWTEELVVKSSVIIEAKLVESDKPVISIRESQPQKEVIKKKVKKLFEPIEESVKPILKPIPKPIPKKVIKEQDLPEINKDFILRYMVRNGTKNESIQNVLYEQASLKVGDTPRELLKFFIKYYKKEKLQE